MRYRMQDSNGDYSFGHGAADFLVNSAQAVAQAIKTRLLLFQGEWFLDYTAGTPWLQQIIGSGALNTRDIALKEIILGTPGVTGITSYASTINPATRQFSVSVTVSSLYGPASVTVAP